MTSSPTLAGHDVGNEAGFTLVELLVALALFSFLVTLLFGNVRFGLKAWRQSSAHIEHFEHSMVSQDLLRRLIGDIYPMFVADGESKPRIDFEGAKDVLSFLGNAPIAVGAGGRFRFILFVDRQQNRTDFVMSSTPELANPQDQSLKSRTVLLSDVDRAEFSYFGVSPTEQSAQWHDAWAQRGEMPMLVRIRIVFRSGEVGSWPELLIAPRITADVSCIYDPMTTRCRGR